MIGEPDAGNPHVRFDEGRQETCVRAARLSPTLQSPQVKRCFLPNVVLISHTLIQALADLDGRISGDHVWPDWGSPRNHWPPYLIR